jgi:hypothetical protein
LRGEKSAFLFLFLVDRFSYGLQYAKPGIKAVLTISLYRRSSDENSVNVFKIIPSNGNVPEKENIGVRAGF